jgi:hypothetical protein
MGVAVALLLVAAIALSYQMSGREVVGAAAASSAFYTDDNGKAFFKDDTDKLPPFEHNGKQAYRCDVFQDAGGKQFVGLIYRFTDSGRQQMQDYLPKKSKDADGAARRAIEERGMQVKPIAAAGDAAWRYADDITVAQLRAAVKNSSKQQAILVQP